MNKKTILIVDDAPENLDILKELLSPQFKLQAAPNGEIGYKIATLDPHPDLIVSDVLMPVMDGFQFCMKIKSNPSTKNIPFVFLTASYTDSRDIELAEKIGVDTVICKPVEPSEILNKITELLTPKKEKKLPKNYSNCQEKEVLQLYNERLVKKLEEKLIELEKEVEERKKAEKKIRHNLEEKNLLLEELYHRTKNNMQVITSMTKMVMRKYNDTKFNNSLQDVIDKIKSMALVHQKLCESHNLSQISLKDYISSLLNRIMIGNREMKSNISLHLDLLDYKATIDLAVPLGMVLTELITNVMKHAFPDGRKGLLSIIMKRDENNLVVIEFADNGVGIDQKIDLRNINTLGMNNIFNLIEHQIRGKVDYKSENGLKWSIRFDDNLKQVRI